VLVLGGIRGGLLGAGLVVLLAPVVRLALWYFVPSAADGIGHRFETVADALAMGCLLAGLSGRLMALRWYRRVLESRAFFLVPFAVFAASALHDRPRLYFLFSFTIMNAGAALCVHWAVVHHAGRVGRVLNAAPLVFVGVISYSIYLWQQVFLNRYSDVLTSTFPLNIVLVFAAAVASFYLVERPFLRMRHRVERRMFPRRVEQFLQTAQLRSTSTPLGTTPNVSGQPLS
jgi:peptidoglycan/LPS O-acetylase OafA/YrhL